MTKKEIIEQLDLQMHPEGGYFREVYRSEGQIPKNVLDKRFSGNRNYGTSIYFLMTSGINFSAFHKINQDELWYYHYGATVRIHVISPEGEYYNILLGLDFEREALPQAVVPAEHWFAAEVLGNGEDFSLVGCAVTPAFDFDDFVLADRFHLSNMFPQHSKLIERFTR